MSDKQIVITQYDLDRLQRLVNDAVASGTRDDLTGLIGELNRATVVTPSEVPPDVVTMNSRVRLVDVETDDVMEISLVFPEDAASDTGAVSILAPVGTAIIGFSQGDSVDWPTPSGLRTFRIDAIIFQPEAAGEWDL